MIRTSILAITLCSFFGLASAATAADTYCTQLDKALAGVSDEFASLRGALREGEKHVWVAKEALPGSEDCIVVQEISRAYVCTLYAGDDDEKARIAYADNVDRAGKCLGKEWKGSEKADGEVTQHTFSRAADAPTVRIRSEIARAQAYTVQLWVDLPAE